MMVGEIWKPVVGYEGLYEISNYGNLRGLPRILPNGIPIVGYVKSYRLKDGYKCVTLKNKGAKYYSIHRLVAIAFIENPLKRWCVNHIDGDKLNNHISNLEWVTSSENAIHAYRTGFKKPKLNGFKRTPVIDTKSGKAFESMKSAHKHCGKYHFVYFCNMVSGRKKNLTNYVTIKSLEDGSKEREENAKAKNRCSQLIINGLE